MLRIIRPVRDAINNSSHQESYPSLVVASDKSGIKVFTHHKANNEALFSRDLIFNLHFFIHILLFFTITSSGGNFSNRKISQS